MFVCTVISRPESAPKAAQSVLQELEKLKLSPQSPKQLADHVWEIDLAEAACEHRPALYTLADQLSVDIVVLPRERRNKKLVVFDMDSTLIMNECIDLIAARANVQPQVADITERAMRGELDFSQSLAERVALLKGVSTSVYEELISEITLTPGARELCAGLKSHGVKMAVLSGGFQPIVDWIKGVLGLDYAFANHLVEKDGKLEGLTEGPVVDGARKALLLREIAEREQISLEDVVAVGDGSNDLPMMDTAGFGIAWHAKPIVQQKAPSRLNSESLSDCLYILGYK